MRQIRQIYNNDAFQTHWLVAAARHPVHVIVAAALAADVCTMSFGVFAPLYDHPLTDAGAEPFLQDGSKGPRTGEGAR